MSTYMPSDEYEERTANRRPEFVCLLNAVWENCRPELDIYDWDADATCEPLFVSDNEAQWIENLLIGTDFKMEYGDRAYPMPRPQKIWIHDKGATSYVFIE